MITVIKKIIAKPIPAWQMNLPAGILVLHFLNARIEMIFL